MPQVSKEDISRDFPSTPAGSDYQSMLLSTRERAHTSLLRNAIFVYQPLRGGRIDERQVDLITVLSAELLKRSVGDEGIEYLQFAFADEALHLGNGDAQQVGRTIPGICIVLFR